jgi:membrane-associated protein
MDLFHQLIEFIRDPGKLIAWGGYPGMALVIFVETGALIFFLPGDSLLVVAGLYAFRGSLNIALLNLLLIPMAILGDAVSYTIGARSGPHIFNRPRSRWFNPEHLKEAHRFYEKYGGITIIAARFMPILRTFVPVVAGVAQMTYRRFLGYNVIGAGAWVLSMTLIGYSLGSFFERIGFPIDKHIEKLILVVVFFSILPMLIKAVQARRGAK